MPQGLMLTDLAIAGALLLIAKVLRVNIPLLQRLYLPSAVLAGLLGLLFGPAILNVLPWTQTFSHNASLLTAALFSALGLATDLPSPKIVAQRAGSLWAFNQIASVSQWLFAALFGLGLTTWIWPTLNPAFGITLSSGFMGGHGSAAVVGNILDDLGWEDGFTLGLTFATVGIFLSISIGMLLLQLGVKMGWIHTFTAFSNMDSYQRKGLIKPDHQKAVMKDTMSSLSVDSFAIHAALVVLVTACSYLSSDYLSSFFDSVQIPTFVTGFLAGMLLRLIAKRTHANQYLCDNAFNHAAGISTDYLIIFGISAIKITVVAHYLLPMTVMAAGGVAFTLWLILWVAPRILGEGWFEKGLFSWGWLTGTVAMGIALLRIVDPEMKGTTLDDYAIAYVPGSITDIFIISLMPIAMYNGYHWEALGIGLAYILAVLCVWRFMLPRAACAH
ncbi:sodium/glutamate symporter [Photobacterium aphoticum]|uniref:Sodium:glutamate symporter n=1 Tax=Photobacterium aphoticum TaxID=754436 RepID=A0A0J1GRJ7_9GAMM|nr:sodium/glutamate symporter [Photobacterium aphoticum]KLV02291.1 sodium:glutamate symporter [Photobacterium aphoticum]PSU57725.1 sodium:glutamate symporter [Photobacterium aphoticum]GHA55268.1 sodium:glutamate symporter [Photobacterium aphoticum]